MAIGIDIKMTKFFFDREKVIRDTNRKERQALIRIGSFVRRRARSLIRSRKRKPKRGKQARLARKGQPPISYQKPGIRDILFVYNPGEKSVDIGPVQFNSGDVPGILEHGGTTTVTESRYADRQMGWQPGLWTDGPVETRKRNVAIGPHPFMGPALEAEQQTILDAFEQAGAR